MTRNKAEKRAVRQRMTKTGERYTTARHHLLDLHQPEHTNDAATSIALAAGTAEVGPEAAATSPEWVEHPGMSNEAIARNTGKDWQEWFAILDQWGGTGHTHAEIARYLNEVHNPGGWFAQGITVGYERARGMRQMHERTDGFSVNASKTVPVPVARLYAALVDEDLRDQWLEPGTLRVRTSQPDKSVRFDVVAGGALLTAHLIAKDDARSTVQLQELRLAGAAEVELRRAFWKERLARLATLLTAAS